MTDGERTRFTHRRIDRVSKSANDLQFQTDCLLDRCRDLRYHTNLTEVVALAALFIVLGAPWYFVIPALAAVHLYRHWRLERGERGADKILEEKRVPDEEDFKTYAD